MKIFREVNNLQEYLNKKRGEGSTIGFVPTMGALHKGHIGLVKQCVKDNDISVCSIFINPVQFNEKNDFKNYPKTEGEDIKLLEKANIDVVFIPDASEVYPDGVPEKDYSFGGLENVMEGKNRPGHFNGVALVVERLFEIVKPHKAYFGKKDYQQMLIIRKLIEELNLNIEIIPVEIYREGDGLAMSSRNMRLNEHQRKIAPYIYQLLKKTKEAKEYMSPKEIKIWLKKQLSENDELDLEYFEIASKDGLNPIDSWYEASQAIGFIVVRIGEVRLIDNIEYFKET